MEKKYHYWEISITEYFKIIKGGKVGVTNMETKEMILASLS